MLLAGNARRNEDSQVTDGFVNCVDDRLPVRADLVHVVVEIKYPPKRLLRRRDVVPLRAEHDDRRLNVAQVDRGAVGCFDAAGREVVPNEKFINDELDLFRVQVDMTSPPPFEAQIS